MRGGLRQCVFFALSTALTPTAHTASDRAQASNPEFMARGKEITFDAKKGNCLACHQIDGGESAGDLGPPLVAIAARFPDKKRLREQLWDAMENNPNSRMPPFGRHRMLTEEEIDMVVEYIYSL
jgi:sulfur-oxidizing protein SoxX